MKNKYLGVAWIALSVGLLGGGSFVAWRKVRPTSQLNSFGAEADASASNNQSDNSSTTAGGLSISPSTSATDLGQLGGSNGQSPLGQTNRNSSGTDSSSSARWPDPSTFAQYDKYKNNQTPLFGDVIVGSGAALASGQKAAVYYKGFLTNGQVFDQSKPDTKGNLQPFVFSEGAHQVIAGWEEGLAGMKVGGARLLIVPPAFGYGAQAQGSIPANSVLVFEIQLLEVQ